jgi:3-deoxy-alpha-D-manno-octulosonate 8-oxidase
MHKNFKGIEKTVFGRGSFSQLGEIIAPHRSENNGYMVFIVDNYFKGKELRKPLARSTRGYRLFH